MAHLQQLLSRWPVCRVLLQTTLHQKVGAAAALGAGVLGAVANCPFDVCRSVAQKELIGAWVSGGDAVTRAPGLAHAVAAGRSVVAARGARGLWAGVGFKSLHLGCGGALMAVLQPACERAWAKARA